MANLESILNELDEVLESAVTLPLTNKCMVDADRIRELIDDIRLNMPSEIKQARAVVADRNEILSMAKQEAEELIRKTEERAKALVDNDTIVRQANAKGMAMLSEASQKAVTEDLRAHFRPEFLNRLDEIIMFKPLTRDNIYHIIDLLVADVNRRLKEKEVSIELTEAAKARIVEGGYEPMYGARPLKRYLQKNVETTAARLMLEGNVGSGDTILIDDENGKLTARVKEGLTATD